MADETDEFLNGAQPAATPPAKTPPPTTAPTKTAPAPKAPEPKRNPSRAFARVGRLNPESLPVSLRMAPPITRRKHAVYELIGVKNKIDHRVIQGPNKIDPQIYELSPTYHIYDQYDENIANRNKIITYSEGMENYTYNDPVTGRPEARLRAKIVSPFFSNAQKIVDIEANYLQYLWWELHPRNASNKFYDNKKRPIFKRTDLDFTNPNTELVRIQLRQDAHEMINKSDHTKLVGLATALNMPTFLPPLELRLQLHHLADSKGGAEKILYSEPDNKATVKLSVIKAMDIGVLDYAADVQQFFLGTDTNDPLYVVVSGKDPIDDVTTFFLGKGQDAYQSMLDQVNHWL